MDELVEQFDSEYESMIPAPNSSVGTDYPIRQVALGTYYTNQSLRLLYDQNQLLLERQEELIEKYDRMINLSERMVTLLTRIAEQTELMPETVGGNPGQ
jgi:pilus assembly protein TadC